MIKYWMKALFGMNYKSFFRSIDIVHKKSKKSKIVIFFDMIKCQIKYGAGHNDYRLYEFYSMKHKQRDTFLTRVRNKKIIEALNDKQYRDLFLNKAKFNERFKEYLCRDTADINKIDLKEFKEFITKHPVIFCKPYDGDSGKGIEKLDIKNYKNEEEMYNYIKEKNIGVLEEPITQHPDMAKVNPYAVNCMRLVTVVNENDVDIIYGVVKFGTTKAFVDNMGYGALSSPIDLKTGRILGPAQNEHEQVIAVHPVSNIQFEGFQIPLFEETVKFIKKAALEIPEVRQVGWDVCVGVNGPAIIEGNDWTDYMFWQLPSQNPKREGLMNYYRKILPDLKI